MCLRSGGRRCTRKLPILSAQEAPELGLIRRKGPEAGHAEGDVGPVSAERACTLSQVQAARVGGRAPGRSRLTAPCAGGMVPVPTTPQPVATRAGGESHMGWRSHTWPPLLTVPVWGRDGGRGRWGVWDGHTHTAVFNMGC